jgi:hypothetical protein
VNTGASVVIVGITPGRRQARNALLEAHKHLHAGDGYEIAARAAKSFLQKKPHELLSAETNADLIDAARARLRKIVAQLAIA